MSELEDALETVWIHARVGDWSHSSVRTSSLECPVTTAVTRAQRRARTISHLLWPVRNVL